MEDSRPPVNEDETRLSGSKNKTRTFLDAWQDRWHELFSDQSDDEEDDVEKSPKEKRFSKGWKKFWPWIAKTEPVDSPKAPSLDTLFESQTIANTTELMAETPQLPIEKTTKNEFATTTETPAQASTIEELHPSWKHAFPTEGETKIKHDNLSIEKVAVAPEVPVSESETIQTPVEVPPPIPTELITPRFHYEELPSSPSSNREAVNTEPIPDNVGPARRSIERKLDYQTWKLNRESKKRDEQLKRAINKTPQTSEQTSPQPERVVDRQTEVVERAPSISSIKKPEKRPEQISTSERTESLPTASEPTTPETPTISPEMSPNLKVETPKVEAVLERVVEAAEHNEPIEKRYEQRHEIKDQNRASPPVPIGAVVTEALEQYHQQTASPQLTSTESLHQTLAKQQQTHDQGEMYRAAIKWGFWSAAAIIVFALLAYLAIR